MNYETAINLLKQTKKGNYKKEYVENVIKILTDDLEKLQEPQEPQEPQKIKCPVCKGEGRTHSACAFGGSGDWHTCKTCNGTGKIPVVN